MSISEKIIEGLVWATSNAIKSELFSASCLGGVGAIGALALTQQTKAIPYMAPSAAYTGVLVGLAYSSVMQFDKFALGCAAVGALLSSYYYGCKGKHVCDLFNPDNRKNTDFNLVKTLDNLGFGALLGTAAYAAAQVAISSCSGR